MTTDGSPDTAALAARLGYEASLRGVYDELVELAAVRNRFTAVAAAWLVAAGFLASHAPPRPWPGAVCAAAVLAALSGMSVVVFGGKLLWPHPGWKPLDGKAIAAAGSEHADEASLYQWLADNLDTAHDQMLAGNREHRRIYKASLVSVGASLVSMGSLAGYEHFAV